MEKDNEDLNYKEQTKKSQEAEIIEVPSKKFVIAGKVLAVADRADINSIIGEKLNTQELKEELITAVKKNGEEAKEENKDKEVKFTPKKILAVGIAFLMLLLSVASCDRNNEIEYIDESIPIVLNIDNLENPHVEVGKMVGNYGQEAMTANAIEGSAFEGQHYSWQEQADAETATSSKIMGFEEIKEQIDLNIEILTSHSSAQQQRYEAAKTLLDLSKQAENAYKENQPMAQEYTERFKEVSEAYIDENTQNEKLSADIFYEDYMQELGLSTANVSSIEELVQLFEEGYTIDLEMEKELDGDYVITGEGVRKVAVNEDIDQSKGLWQKFADFIKGRSEKEIEK